MRLTYWTLALLSKLGDQEAELAMRAYWYLKDDMIIWQDSGYVKISTTSGKLNTEMVRE